MSVFGDNIARLRTQAGMTQRDVAAKLEISKGTVGAWETKDTLPDYPKIQKLAELFDVPVQLLFSVYYPSRDDENFASTELRVYGKIAAGTPIDMEEGDYGFPCPSYLLKKHPKAFYLEIDGESMNNVLPNGSLALVDPALKDHHINGNIYALCINGYSATTKCVRFLENGVELIPDSKDPTFHAQVYDRTVEGTESITIIGEVVWYSIPFDFKI